jgi:hypothetical protein
MKNTTKAAAYLDCSPSYLEKLRVTGGGPEYVKLGRSVRYEDDALDRYKAERRRRSTSDGGTEQARDNSHGRKAGRAAQ